MTFGQPHVSTQHLFVYIAANEMCQRAQTAYFPLIYDAPRLKLREICKYQLWSAPA